MHFLSAEAVCLRVEVNLSSLREKRLARAVVGTDAWCGILKLCFVKSFCPRVYHANVCAMRCKAVHTAMSASCFNVYGRSGSRILVVKRCLCLSQNDAQLLVHKFYFDTGDVKRDVEGD